MSFGKYTYGKPEICWENHNAKLKVGNFCSVAGNVKIYLGGNHRTDWVTKYPFGHIHQNIFNNFNGLDHPSTKGDVIIGNDVCGMHSLLYFLFFVSCKRNKYSLKSTSLG